MRLTYKGMLTTLQFDDYAVFTPQEVRFFRDFQTPLLLTEPILERPSGYSIATPGAGETDNPRWWSFANLICLVNGCYTFNTHVQETELRISFRTQSASVKHHKQAIPPNLADGNKLTRLTEGDILAFSPKETSVGFRRGDRALTILREYRQRRQVNTKLHGLTPGDALAVKHLVELTTGLTLVPEGQDIWIAKDWRPEVRPR